MKTYIVKFYYFTDLRIQATVKAYNDIMALAVAMSDIHTAEWVTSQGFRVEISLK